MGKSLKHCWEIKNCERQKGGSKVFEFGECVASIEGFGHSCWTIAGTLCGGEVQGSVAKKEKNCMACEVYKSYNRLIGTNGKEVAQQFPAEESRYKTLMLERSKRAA